MKFKEFINESFKVEKAEEDTVYFSDGVWLTFIKHSIDTKTAVANINNIRPTGSPNIITPKVEKGKQQNYKTNSPTIIDEVPKKKVTGLVRNEYSPWGKSYTKTWGASVYLPWIGAPAYHIGGPVKLDGEYGQQIYLPNNATFYFKDKATANQFYRTWGADIIKWPGEKLE